MLVTLERYSLSILQLMFVFVLISLTLAISVFSLYCLRANVLFRSGNETSDFFVSHKSKSSYLNRFTAASNDTFSNNSCIKTLP